MIPKISARVAETCSQIFGFKDLEKWTNPKCCSMFSQYFRCCLAKTGWVVEGQSASLADLPDWGSTGLGVYRIGASTGLGSTGLGRANSWGGGEWVGGRGGDVPKHSSVQQSWPWPPQSSPSPTPQWTPSLSHSSRGRSRCHGRSRQAVAIVS